MTKVGHWEETPEKAVRQLTIRKSGYLLNLVYKRYPRKYGAISSAQEYGCVSA